MNNVIKNTILSNKNQKIVHHFLFLHYDKSVF